MTKPRDVPTVIPEDEEIAAPGQRIEIDGTESTFRARTIFARLNRHGIIVVVAQLVNWETGADVTAKDWDEMYAALAAEDDDDAPDLPGFR
jgi:hypothetical protein